MKELLEIAADCGIVLDKKCLDKFEVYYKLLIEWNEKINLTSITEAKEVALKHFADSLSAEKFIPKNANVADVGTGAGFPGIPLKLTRSDISLVLMDSLNKRVTFLNELIEKLNLEKTKAVHIRAEEAGKGIYREQFDVVTARAVARLNALCEYCLPLVKKGGIFIAYKTKDEQELQEAQEGVKRLGGEIGQVWDFNLKELSRQLIIIKKINYTPEQYPRDAGKIKKNPLK